MPFGNPTNYLLNDENLAEELPEKTAELNARLTEILTAMKASYPYWNPDCKFGLPNQKKAPTVTGHKVDGHTVTATFQENGARVVRADVLYAIDVPMPPKQTIQEWFRMEADINNGALKANVPTEATHAYINLVDENHFLVSHPKPVSGPDSLNPYAATAIPLGAKTNH